MACSSAVEQPAPPPLSIAWGSCSNPNGDKSITTECATVGASARRGVADSGTTPVAIYRLKSKKQSATAQMRFLDGGPG